MNGVLHDVVAVIVRDAILEATLDAGSGQPRGKTAAVMVAAMVVLRQGPLRVNRSAKFATTYHQCVVQHSSLLQVLDETGGGMVDVFALKAEQFGEVAVLVPTTVK